MIDPAAHGGHPYTDLAMLELVGTPFYDDILRGYGAGDDVATIQKPTGQPDSCRHIVRPGS